MNAFFLHAEVRCLPKKENRSRSKPTPSLGPGQPSLHTHVKETGLHTNVEENGSTRGKNGRSKIQFKGWT